MFGNVVIFGGFFEVEWFESFYYKKDDFLSCVFVFFVDVFYKFIFVFYFDFSISISSVSSFCNLVIFVDLVNVV